MPNSNNTLQFDEYLLIVDDDETIRVILASIAKECGVKTETANSGTEALKKLRENTYFLVLTDYNMPGMTGLELSGKIRESNPLLPIALVTGQGEKEMAIAAIRYGFVEFLEKPLDVAYIQNFIGKVVKERLADIERETLELAELKSIFIEEAKSVLIELEEQVAKLADSSPTIDDLNVIYRKVHTLKGSAGSVPSAKNLVSLAHVFETSLTLLKSNKLTMSPDLQSSMATAVDSLNSCIESLGADRPLPDCSAIQGVLHDFNEGRNKPGVMSQNVQIPSVKMQSSGESSDDGLFVSSDKLELLKELSGELVAFKNTFDVFLKQNSETLGSNLREMIDMDRVLFKITDSLQTEVTDLQQVTLAKTFAKFPRVVRQISGELGKQIKLQITGQEVTVDRTVSRQLGDALIHAVRNSCDHGIEKPDQRTKAGKATQGTITIKGAIVGDMISVEVQDDGGGLNRERILKKALENKILDEEAAKEIPDAEVWNLLFLPNFSTATQVSNISGRGVGMDVVKTVANKFGGNAWFTTEPGRSTQLTIQFPIPRSLIVEPSIIAQASDVTLAIPLSAVAEIRTVLANEMNFVKPYWTFQHRGSTVPVGAYSLFVKDDEISMEERVKSSCMRDSLVVILNYQNRFVGLFVDKIIDQLEAVIRPFNDIIGRISGFKGVSRLPGDEVAYVVSAEDAIRNTFDLSKSIVTIQHV